MHGAAVEEAVEQRLAQVVGEEAELEEEHDELDGAHPERVRHDDHETRLVAIHAQKVARIDATVAHVSSHVLLVLGVVEAHRRHVLGLHLGQIVGNHERDDGERADRDLPRRAEYPVDEHREEGRVQAVDGRQGGEQRVAHALRYVHDGDRAAGEQVGYQVLAYVVGLEPLESRHAAVQRILGALLVQLQILLVVLGEIGEEGEAGEDLYCVRFAEPRVVVGLARYLDDTH